MKEIKFSKKEETIMREAFMTGRIYHSMGEKENPHEIQTKLKESCIKALKRENIPLDGLVIKTEAETVNTVSANLRAKRWAMMNFDKWNEVTGFVDPHISYYDEITALIEDAVEFGYGVALKQPLKEIMKVIKKSEGSL